MPNQSKGPDPFPKEFNLPTGPKDSSQSRKNPFKLTIIYAVFGAIWIVVTDVVTQWLFAGRETYIVVQTVKGLLYIAVTSLLVYWLARRSVIKLENEQLENQLQHTKQLLKATLASLGEAVIIVDPATRAIVECNPAAERMFGYERNEMIGRSTELLHVSNEAFQAFGDLSGPILDEKGFFQTEFRMKTKDGAIIDTENTVSRLDEKLGWKGGAVSIVRDVTAHKRDQKLLADKEEKYRLLADNTLDIIWAMTMDLEFTYVNPAVKQLLGYEPEEFIGTNLQDHCDEATFARLRQGIMQEMANPSKEGVLLEIEMLRRDGSPVPLEVHGLVIFDQQRKPIGIQGTSRDIAKREEARRKLENSENRFRTLFERANEGIVVADAETGRFIFGNPAMSSLLGYSQEELSQIGVEDIHPQEVLPALMSDFENLTEGGNLLTTEAPCLRKDGTIVYADINAVYMEIDGKRCNVGFFTDVTEILEGRHQHKVLLDRITSLHRIDQIINSLPPLDVALQQVVRETVQNLDVDAANILKLQEPQHRLESYAQEGFSSAQAADMVLHLDEGYAGRSLMDRETITASNIQAEEEKFARKEMARAEGFHGYACCPIVSRGKVSGVLEVFRRSFSPPASEQLEFLETLAHQAAIAIDNITTLEELQSANERLLLAYDANIEGWSRALDYRDKETEGHSRRVTEIATELAKRVGMDENQLRYIRWGALLHDIGKMGVPDHILLKPGRLNEEEWEIMKHHPVIARDLMSPIRFLEPAIDIPYCHHEKWDGSGYPRGLKGGDIPIAARIFAVADVWDALRSDRPYRRGWTEEEALNQLKEIAGSHLDPEIVQVFCDSVHDIPACSSSSYTGE